jgi:hypothetical protein
LHSIPVSQGRVAGYRISEDQSGGNETIYYHAKRTNLIIALVSFKENVNKLTNYCYDEKNFKVPIMEAIERIVGK